MYKHGPRKYIISVNLCQTSLLQIPTAYVFSGADSQFLGKGGYELFAPLGSLMIDYKQSIITQAQGILQNPGVLASASLCMIMGSYLSVCATAGQSKKRIYLS